MTTKRQDYNLMTPIDLKKLGIAPYSEMDARAIIHPEHGGYVEIVIPAFEQEAVRMVNALKLSRVYDASSYPTKEQAKVIIENSKVHAQSNCVDKKE